MSDGCGKTCACASGETLYQGACCTPNCPDGREPRRHVRRLRQDLQLRQGDHALHGRVLHAELPRPTAAAATCPTGAARPAPAPAATSRYKGACCKPNCPSDGSEGGKSDSCGGTCACPTGESIYSGSCCKPNCPADGSRAGMSDGCGKTCACPTGETSYQSACCEPYCPSDGTCGQSDGCGGTCGCAGGGTCKAGLCPGKTCTPACGCGEICNNGQCLPHHLQSGRRLLRLRLLQPGRQLRRRTVHAGDQYRLIAGSAGKSARRTTCAGTPTAVAPAGTSSITTAPAPIFAPLPTTTPPMTEAFAPT